jgi:hypothetical protein
MPYKSDAQRRFMHARHPEIAARWDAEIRRKKKVAKRMSPEHKLRAQKKVQAGTSIAGSTIGLTGLGMLAASKKYPHLLDTLPKVTAVGAGIGGVGGFNFASIQNKESKLRGPKQNVYVVRNKRQIKNIKTGLEPVKKGIDTMDFGLSDVHQGESVVQKRYSAEGNRQKRLDHYSTAAKLGSTTLGTAAAYGGIRAGVHKNPKLATASGALALGAIGSGVAAHRIKSYKRGKGAPYRPLARRQID